MQYESAILIITCFSCPMQYESTMLTVAPRMQYESTMFFVLAAVGAASVMLTFVVLVTAAAGGTVFSLSRMTGRMGRLQGQTVDGRRRLRGEVPGYSATSFGPETYYRAHRRSESPANAGAATGAPSGGGDPGGADSLGEGPRRRGGDTAQTPMEDRSHR